MPYHTLEKLLKYKLPPIYNSLIGYYLILPKYVNIFELIDLFLPNRILKCYYVSVRFSMYK